MANPDDILATIAASIRAIDKAKTFGNDLFGPVFVPAARTHPELSSPETVIDQVFSYDELVILEDLLVIDENMASNSLGIAIFNGRRIDSGILSSLLYEGLGEASKMIFDTQAFFRDIGKIVTENFAQEIEAHKKGLAIPEFIDPAEVAFARFTGLPSGQVTAIFNGDAIPNQPQPGVPETVVANVIAQIEEFANSYFGGDSNKVSVIIGEGNDVAVIVDDSLVSTNEFAHFGSALASFLQTLDPNEVAVEDKTKAENFDLASFLSDILTGVQKEEDAPGDVIDAFIKEQIANGVSDGPVTDPLVLKALHSLFGEDPGSILFRAEPVDHGDVSSFKGAEPIKTQDAFSIAHAILDESLEEFRVLAQAGKNDSNILGRQINDGVNQLKVITALINEDANKLIDAANGVKAGLAMLEENSNNLDALQGNAKMIADAFDALEADVNTLQRLRAN